MKSTDIGSDHGDSKNLKEKVATDRQTEKIPVGHIISSPVSRVVAGSNTGTTTNNEWPLLLLAEEVKNREDG